MPKLSPEALKKVRRGMFKGWPSDKDPRKLQTKVRPMVVRRKPVSNVIPLGGHAFQKAQMERLKNWKMKANKAKK